MRLTRGGQQIVFRIDDACRLAVRARQGLQRIAALRRCAQVDRGNVVRERAILSSASGGSLAFGLGHLDGTALPNEPGTCAVLGHRDTWASFLRDVKPGETVRVRTHRGVTEYRVTAIRVVHASERGVLDEVDARAMQRKVPSTDGVLEDLVGIRREIGRIRRALSSHREVLLALARPEIDAITTAESSGRFSELSGRLEEGMQAARDSRESVVGSFDVVIASTGQRTTEIMKVLTLASVLLLPGALIAGVLGMNFSVGFFEQTGLFWVTIAVIAGIIVATAGIARAKRWI